MGADYFFCFSMFSRESPASIQVGIGFELQADEDEGNWVFLPSIFHSPEGAGPLKQGTQVFKDALFAN